MPFNREQNDSYQVNIYIYILTALFATILRLLLLNGVFISFRPDTGYDDMMQIHKAMSISAGEWLGEYGSMTLVKGVGFPIITAFFHFIGLPYQIGWSLIYVAACVIFVWAVSSIVRSDFCKLLIYLVLLYNPISFSVDVNRYYRDIGYYAVAFLAIALFIAVMLRQTKLAAFAAGIALAIAVLVREDAQWLIIYAVACVLAGMFLSWPVCKKVLARCICVAILVIFGYLTVTLPVCLVNYSRYGTFTLDEYNSGSYAKAYGALSRLDGGLQDSTLTIPYAERLKLYKESAAFGELYPVLDGPNAPYTTWKEVQGEYRTGYFSFVLRDAAQMIGKFETAQTANEYFTQIAVEANAYADTVPGAGRRRSGIVARLYLNQIPGIVRATMQGCIQAAKFSGISAIPVPVDADDDYLAVYEKYTNSICAANRYMTDTGDIVENYHLSGWRLWMQRGVRVCIHLYQIVIFPLACLAVLLWIIESIRILLRKKKREQVRRWVVVSSLLCVFLLRETMLGFVHHTTFSAINTPAYQAASYAPLLAFILIQILSTIHELFEK